MFFAAGPLESAIVKTALGFVPPKELERMVGYGTLESVLDALESALVENDFVAGSQFSAVDIYVGSQITWGLQQETIGPRDCFKTYSERVTSRAAYQRANQLDDALV